MVVVILMVYVNSTCFLKHAFSLDGREQNTHHVLSDKSFKNKAESSNLIPILVSFHVLDIFPEFNNIATCYSGNQLS